MQLVRFKSQSQRLHGLISKRIQAVLDHGQCILGAEIAELERHSPSTWARTICIALSSGTDAPVSDR
jgi:UDP-2-acetamido-2-deoxy-ribo-hexuluronate aminotransferase